MCTRKVTDRAPAPTNIKITFLRVGRNWKLNLKQNHTYTKCMVPSRNLPSNRYDRHFWYSMRNNRRQSYIWPSRRTKLCTTLFSYIASVTKCSPWNIENVSGPLKLKPNIRPHPRPLPIKDYKFDSISTIINHDRNKYSYVQKSLWLN